MSCKDIWCSQVPAQEMDFIFIAVIEKDIVHHIRSRRHPKIFDILPESLVFYDGLAGFECIESLLVTGFWNMKMLRSRPARQTDCCKAFLN